MTDKQIIIDGVDVSGCEFFEPKAQVMQCHRGALTQRCKANNCYYKQLARKTQEYELLVRTNKIHVDTLDQLNNKYIDLEQECEELKNEYWKLEQGNDFLAEKNSRLKGCLAEIKEIAEPFCNACQEFEPEKKGSNCMYCNYGIILRKISEVEKWQIKNR